MKSTRFFDTPHSLPGNVHLQTEAAVQRHLSRVLLLRDAMMDRHANRLKAFSGSPPSPPPVGLRNDHRRRIKDAHSFVRHTREYIHNY